MMNSIGNGKKGVVEVILEALEPWEWRTLTQICDDAGRSGQHPSYRQAIPNYLWTLPENTKWVTRQPRAGPKRHGYTLWEYRITEQGRAELKRMRERSARASTAS